jgi:hypothetical protein
MLGLIASPSQMLIIAVWLFASKLSRGSVLAMNPVAQAFPHFDRSFLQ